MDTLISQHMYIPLKQYNKGKVHCPSHNSEFFLLVVASILWWKHFGYRAHVSNSMRWDMKNIAIMVIMKITILKIIIISWERQLTPSRPPRTKQMLRSSCCWKWPTPHHVIENLKYQSSWYVSLWNPLLLGFCFQWGHGAAFRMFSTFETRLEQSIEMRCSHATKQCLW